MWRLRKSIKKKLLLSIVFIVIQGLLFFWCQFTVKQITVRKYEAILKEKNAILEAAGRVAYVTRKDLKAGELFTEENTEKRYLLSEQNPDSLARNVIGLIACADLPEGVIINTSVCCEPEFDPLERKCIFYDIAYAENFPEYTTVDVRIRYANGENYCVLNKKRLQSVGEGKASCFLLTEEEQLLMSAARYDTEIYRGAELYLVAFTEERLQENAINSYLPSIQVMTQIKECSETYRTSYETQCKLRRELENRLLEYQSMQKNGLL